MTEKLWVRCPRLGGEVPFSYCLQEGGELPCHRTVLCWRPYFPVETFLRERLTPQVWDECFGNRQKDKVTSLVELSERAMKSAS